MMTATEIAAAVNAGQLRATDVVTECLDRIARLNPRLNAFTAVTAERALRRAETLALPGKPKHAWFVRWSTPQPLTAPGPPLLPRRSLDARRCQRHALE